MRPRSLFSTLLKILVITGIALSGSALGLEINDFPRTVEAGKTYTLTYSPADNTVGLFTHIHDAKTPAKWQFQPTTFILNKGENTNLVVVATLTSTIYPTSLISSFY